MKKEMKKYQYFTKAIRCPDGSRKYIRGKTKKELDQKVQSAMLQTGMGVNLNDDTTFGQLAQMWVDVYKRPRNKPQSMRAVLSLVNNYMMPRLGSMRVRDIKPAHIAMLLVDASSLSRGSQTILLSHLRSIFDLAIENQIVGKSPVSPMIRPTAAPSPGREPLTPEETDLLLQAVDATGREWLMTFVRLCLFTGLRAAEACGLCWDCVDFDAMQLRVRRQVVYRSRGALELTDTLKTPSAFRDLPMPPELAGYLRALRLRTASTLVLPAARGGLLRPTTAGGTLAKISFCRHLHPHLLRHTYATRLVENGVDIKEVQYLLGHSNPNMAMSVYAHYDRRSRAKATSDKVCAISFTASDSGKSQKVANCCK